MINLQKILSGSQTSLLVVNAEQLTEIVRNAVVDEAKRIANEKSAANEVAGVSRADAARMLSVNVNTLWRWAKAGYLVPKKVGKKVVYVKTDIENLIKKGYETENKSQVAS